MINNQEKIDDIINKLPKIKWVTFQDRIYDLSNFTHPAGDILIEKCNGRDVSRFLIDGFQLETISDIKRHTHSMYAIWALEQYYIGNIMFEN